MAEASNKSPRKEKKKRKKSQSQVKSEEQTPTALYCSTPAVPVQREARSKQEETEDVHGNKYCTAQQRLRWKKRKTGIIFFFPWGSPHRADSHSFASLVAAGYCSVNMQWNASWGCLRVLSTALSASTVWCELDLRPITNACMHSTVLYSTALDSAGMENKKKEGRKETKYWFFCFFPSLLQNLIC